MLRRISPFLAVLTLLIVCGNESAIAQLYTVRDLGTGTYSAIGVNNAAFVSGITSTFRAFKWSPVTGSITVLPLLIPGVNAGGMINFKGDVAGWYYGGAPGLFWGANGSSLILKSFVDYDGESYVSAMNDSSIVVGASTFNIDNLGIPLNQACYWKPYNSTNPQPLASFSGIYPTKNQSWAYGINNSGLIAGKTLVSNNNPYLFHACVWDVSNPAAAPIDLEPGSSEYSEADSISNLGQVAGIHLGEHGDVPCIWTKKANGTWQRQDLDPDGYDGYYIRKINADGVIIGSRSLSFDGGLGTPFIWLPSTHRFQNPQDLVTDWTLTDIADISDSGYIAATGYPDGNTSNQARGLLLRPNISIRLNVPTLKSNAPLQNPSLVQSVYVEGNGTISISGHWLVDGKAQDELSQPNITLPSSNWVKLDKCDFNGGSLSVGKHTITFVIDQPFTLVTSTEEVAITGFDPNVNGWQFKNGEDRGVISQITDGLCAGMCLTALDFYNAHQITPRDFPHPSELHRNQIISAHLKGNVRIIADGGLARLIYKSGSEQIEFESDNIQQEIYRGNPWVMNIAGQPYGIKPAHEVVATAVFDVSNAYIESNPSVPEDVRRFAVYDPNYPDAFKYIDVLIYSGIYTMDYISADQAYHYMIKY